MRLELRTDVAALDAFYALHVRTRRRLGVPTQPKGFVRDLGALMAGGLGFVALATLGDRHVAAAVFLRAGRTLTYKWGASDERFLNARPNNLLFARVIGWACDEGLLALDLGRTDIGHEGLAAFKRGWGADERPLEYTFAGAPPPSGESRLGRAAGELIRRSPEAVGRAAGELLYRHSG